MLVVAMLALLISAGGITAVYALRTSAEATRRLASEQLMQLREAQELVQRTLLIERESAQLEKTSSVEALRRHYAEILRNLEAFEQLSERLAATDDDIEVLDLHQSTQLFRNVVNIVAQWWESELQRAGTAAACRRRHPNAALPGAVPWMRFTCRPAPWWSRRSKCRSSTRGRFNRRCKHWQWFPSAISTG
ncbi:hypothetical protein [Ralstonia flatus]|uniref:hypothetical protein n=1 Tax=Ralstonia flatus TaxID=3058601 RepID=UPI002931E457|nr:hypothetical protein [Ralstonia sp. LMG 32965]